MANELKKCPNCGDIMHKAYPRCVTCHHSFISKNNSIRSGEAEKVQKSETVEDIFFSTEGRIRRSTFLIRSLLLAMPNLLFALPIENGLYESPGIILFFLLLTIVFGVLSMIQGVKRLHDMNHEGILIFLLLVPLVNIFFYLYMIIKDSHPGKNQYGEDPKKNQRTVKNENVQHPRIKTFTDKTDEKSLSNKYKISELEYLEKLANLKERGIITEDEFKSKKNQILKF